MSQNQARWASQRILFVSGKGGVGKSLIAAGIAQEQAQSLGRRVLLVEIGDNSYYKDFFGLPEVSHEPIRLKQGFDLAMWRGETCLKEYVLYYLKLERLYRAFFENKVMSALINVAPGLNEVAILGKITSGLRKVGPPLEYDLIVVDCFATGHALALLESPKGMMEAIKFGPMGHHSREIHAVLQNPALCGYLAVTLLEEMPVVETLEFRTRMKTELNVDTEILANKLLPLPVAKEELEKLAQWDSKGLGEFAAYLNAIATRQNSFVEQLEREVGVESLMKIPLVFDNKADQLVRDVGEALRQA